MILLYLSRKFPENQLYYSFEPSLGCNKANTEAINPFEWVEKKTTMQTYTLTEHRHTYKYIES